jgi:predicted dehydrogenase
MSDILRIGIVGCGEVAQIIHLPTLQNLRDKFRVTAICDVSTKVLDGVGEQFGVTHRFRDYRELVDSAEVDAVLVANPHVFHAEVALAAIKAGKHVLVEKPMCMSIAEADALIAQEKQAGVVAQVGFMRRYAQAFTEAKRLVQELPDIRLARVHDVIGRNPLIITQINNVIRPTDLPKGAEEELLAKQKEMVTAALGPVQEPLDKTYLLLLGLASHDISAMRELLGLPKGILYAASRGPEGRTVSAAFDYGGFVCQFETSVDTVPRFDAHIEVYSPSRIVRVDYNTPYVRNLPGRLTVLEPGSDGMAQRQVRSTWKDAFEIEWLAFHDNVTQGRRPKTSLADAREDLVLFREMMSLIQGGSPAADMRERVVARA